MTRHRPTNPAEIAAQAIDLPRDARDRSLALLVAALIVPYGYGDPVLTANWILGDKPPIDKHLESLQGEFLNDYPDDDPGALPPSDANDEATEWYAAAMGWKTRAEGAEAAIARARKVADQMAPLKWSGILHDAIKGQPS